MLSATLRGSYERASSRGHRRARRYGPLERAQTGGGVYRQRRWPLRPQRADPGPGSAPDDGGGRTVSRGACCARFPGSIETHSRVQDFFFDDSRMVYRHDYQVNIAGGFPTAQLTSEHVRADGISLPTKRRAYTRGPDRRPILDMLMVSIDFSDVTFS